jgi:Uma2 family endonuclease
MACMSAQTAELLEAIEHLPRGASLVMQEVTWDDYEELLVELADYRSIRVSFDDGRIEFVSPLNKHEKIIRFIDRMVHVFGEIRKLKIEHYGSSNWKRKVLAKGVQPDCCYYINSADLVIGKQQLNLDVDPPPDIAVEIDVTSSSIRKFSIYAALKVPEFWRYDGTKFQIFRLKNETYSEIPASQILPRLTGGQLVETIELSQSVGHTAALQTFRSKI